MLTPPPLVTDEGDIAVHNREGVKIYVLFLDEDGNAIDVSSKSLWFETSSGVRTQLTSGSTTNEKVLTINPKALAAELGKPSSFILKDETTTLHEDLWQGRLFVGGF